MTRVEFGTQFRHTIDQPCKLDNYENLLQASFEAPVFTIDLMPSRMSLLVS